MPSTLRKIIAQPEVVIDLVEAVGVRPDGVVAGARDVIHALTFGRQGSNCRRSRSGYKALRSEGYSQPSGRLAQIIRVACVTEAQFVDGARSQRFGEAQHRQLRAARVQTVEPGHVRASLGRRIGIVLVVIIQRVIAEHRPPPGAGIEALTYLVIVEDLVICRRRGILPRQIWRGNIFQQVRGRIDNPMRCDLN